MLSQRQLPTSEAQSEPERASHRRLDPLVGAVRRDAQTCRDIGYAIAPIDDLLNRFFLKFWVNRSFRQAASYAQRISRACLSHWVQSSFSRRSPSMRCRTRPPADRALFWRSPASTRQDARQLRVRRRADDLRGADHSDRPPSSTAYKVRADPASRRPWWTFGYFLESGTARADFLCRVRIRPVLSRDVWGFWRCRGA